MGSNKILKIIERVGAVALQTKKNISKIVGAVYEDK